MLSFAEAGHEPGIDEMLHDPIIQMVMRRDRIGEADVRFAIHRAQVQLHRKTDASIKRRG